MQMNMKLPVNSFDMQVDAISDSIYFITSSCNFCFCFFVFSSHLYELKLLFRVLHNCHIPVY